ncbi:mucin-2-like [Homarus americanus]|uniref:mucin-2-like n=1 Tax=Homarus americanus TaxID=6706 RepID=UPI001C46A6F3|nr:mucin-2-like [Homarus americanus]
MTTSACYAPSNNRPSTPAAPNQRHLHPLRNRQHASAPTTHTNSKHPLTQQQRPLHACYAPATPTLHACTSNSALCLPRTQATAPSAPTARTSNQRRSAPARTPAKHHASAHLRLRHYAPATDASAPAAHAGYDARSAPAAHTSNVTPLCARCARRQCASLDDAPCAALRTPVATPSAPLRTPVKQPPLCTLHTRQPAPSAPLHATCPLPLLHRAFPAATLRLLHAAIDAALHPLRTNNSAVCATTHWQPPIFTHYAPSNQPPLCTCCANATPLHPLHWLTSALCAFTTPASSASAPYAHYQQRHSATPHARQQSAPSAPAAHASNQRHFTPAPHARQQSAICARCARRQQRSSHASLRAATSPSCISARTRQ